jgi:hypothetical protein
VCSDLLQRGFLTRGAVAKGRLHHEGNVVFGEALTNAYDLEQSTARFARVILTQEVVGSLDADAPAGGPWSRDVSLDLLRRDGDGWCRLNLFARLTAPRGTAFPDFFRSAGVTIKNALATAHPESEPLAKARWLAQAYNVELSALICSGQLQDHLEPQIELLEDSGEAR